MSQEQFVIEDNEGTVFVYEDLSTSSDYVYIESWYLDGVKYNLYRPAAVKLSRLSGKGRAHSSENKNNNKLRRWLLQS